MKKRTVKKLVVGIILVGGMAIALLTATSPAQAGIRPPGFICFTAVK